MSSARERQLREEGAIAATMLRARYALLPRPKRATIETAWLGLRASAKAATTGTPKGPAELVNALLGMAIYAAILAQKPTPKRRVLTEIRNIAAGLYAEAMTAEEHNRRWPTVLQLRELRAFASNVLVWAVASHSRLRDNPGEPADHARARRAYRVTHWGHGGSGKTRRATYADPTGPMAEIGEAMAIEYRTTKLGDPRGSVYRHEFGPRQRPRLAFNVDSKRLAFANGRARMTTKGIEG